MILQKRFRKHFQYTTIVGLYDRRLRNIYSPTQWRSEGGAGGGICPRAPPGGGRQNHAKEFLKIYILRKFEKSERIQ